VRLDYEEIVRATEAEEEITVLCDLQGGISKWPGGGALIFAGSRTHRFNLWILDRETTPAQEILRLIEARYGGRGRGYVYVTGRGEMYPVVGDGQVPQIVLADCLQLSDAP